MTRHHIRMQGDAVFNFVMREVPKMFVDLFACYNMTYNDVESFVCHQPNKFILNRVAKKMGIDLEKIPANIVETFGNSISSTIPCCITHNFGQRPEKEEVPLCLAGFGEGLIWSSTILRLGPLDYCRMIEMDI